MNWRKWVLFVGMSLGLATMITLAWIASALSQSPFPVTVVFLTFVASCLPTMCFYDVQDTDCGDFGWALTGFFGCSSAGLLGVLWSNGEIQSGPAGLAIGSIIATAGTVPTIGWYFVLRKRHKIGFD